MGIGVVDCQQGQLTMVCAHVLAADRAHHLGKRLAYMYDELDRSIREWSPTEVAIEEPFVAKNVRSAMAVGQAQAVESRLRLELGLSPAEAEASDSATPPSEEPADDGAAES